MRIIGARNSAVHEADEAAAAESIRREVAQGGARPDLALRVGELHQELAARIPDGRSRWSLLYLLQLIARDQRKSRGNAPNPYQGATAALASLSSILPGNSSSTSMTDPLRSLNNTVTTGTSVLDGSVLDQSLALGRASSGARASHLASSASPHAGDLVVLSRPAAREALERTDFEVPEPVLVRDVVYACQGARRTL